MCLRTFIVESADIVVRILFDNLASPLHNNLSVFAVHRRLIDELILVLDRLYLFRLLVLLVVLEQLDEGVVSHVLGDADALSL